MNIQDIDIGRKEVSIKLYVYSLTITKFTVKYTYIGTMYEVVKYPCMYTKTSIWFIGIYGINMNIEHYVFCYCICTYYYYYGNCGIFFLKKIKYS